MSFAGRYRPTGPVQLAESGSLEHWLTERYCLYSADSHGVIYRSEIHHEPWPLQVGEAEVLVNLTTSQIGLQLPDTAPLVHFARRLDVVAWLIDPIA
ncbi:hypothetical protein Pla86_29880 [Planctomycetes bacterium Pla86]|uniref:Uncharacterized protein n=2 Tax=Engelhardtia mirabilis TaxID=2528011 RepID=A0A518BLQ3_9BACT|nr:hypothetical protein Pla133_29890 [Planctomycetes bacterium Pla133]QDV02226.1 hypothetical protein Pla86_29880 [Planctomycetes bacterium Pla86]